MVEGPKTYSFDQLHDRAWQITPSAWVIAKSSTPALALADLEDVQILPAEPDGATIVVKIRTKGRGGVTVRGRVSANGDFALSQPETVVTFGSIFDGQADKRLASVIARAIGKGNF